MPEGVVQWFDVAAGEGRVLDGSRRYVVRSPAIEPAARVPGARVHFDIDRRGHPGAALNVTLRPGTRSSPGQHRFGTLAGARAPSSKGTAPFAHQQPEVGRNLHSHPMNVARRWSELLADGDLESMMLLYAPDAVLHAGGDAATGLDPLRRYWSASPLFGGPPALSVDGEGETIVVRWSDEPSGRGPTETHLRVARGQVVEQWLGSVWRAGEGDSAGPPVQLSTSGAVSAKDRAYALDKLGGAIQAMADPVFFASIRLEVAADPARERPALARITLDLKGESVRAHVAAAHMSEAIDLLVARTRARLEQVAEHRRTLRRRGATSATGEWRHGDHGTHRPSYFPRPVDERQVVRRKSFAPKSSSVDEAIFDLEAMDLDFFLFADLDSVGDAIVHRQADGSYRVRYLDGPAGELPAPVAGAVDVDLRPAARLALGPARELLNEGQDPWVFFCDAASGRGHVLYRRYDGHYGLIAPIDEPTVDSSG